MGLRAHLLSPVSHAVNLIHSASPGISNKIRKFVFCHTVSKA